MTAEKESEVAEAQLEKLHLEIAELRRRGAWKFQLLQFLPLLTVLVAVVGVWLSIQQFYTAQDKDRQARIKEENQRLEANKHETETKDRESKKPFLDKQLTVCLEASGAASTIAMLPPESVKRKRAEERFREMYLGELALIEDEEVARAKTNFFNCLEKLEGSAQDCLTEPNRGDKLKDLSWALTSSCRDSISKSWVLDLPGVKNPYHLRNKKRLP